MKFTKSVSLMLLSLIGLSILFFVISGQVVTKKENSGKSFEVNLGKSLPYGAKFVEVKDGTPPPLMEFLLKSDYVVIASAGSVMPVGKRGVDPLNSDASERIVRSLFPVSVESILFSRKAFEDNVVPVPIHKLEILTRSQSLYDLNLSNGTRYLIFLKEIPKDDELYSLLEIDKGKTYYTRYSGTVSIFPGTDRPDHGFTKDGLIDLSAGKFPEVVNNILQLCAALRSNDQTIRMRNLKKLAKSEDKVLRENALYGLKHFIN